MSASDKTWVNNNTPACEDDDLNGFNNENNNLIEGSGQILNTSDNQQTHKAVSAYAAHGDFYSDTGGVNAYVLGAQGAKVAPPAYADGMRIRFQTANANTGPSTVNTGGLGVKDVKLMGGGALIGGEIAVANNNVATYNSSAGYFELEGLVPQATETVRGGGEIATKAEQEAATSIVTLVSPANQRDHPSAITAWCAFDGTLIGTNPPTEGYGVTSVTRTVAGTYVINLSITMATTTFLAAPKTNGDPSAGQISGVTGRTTTTINILNKNSAAALVDNADISITVLGARA